jgi:hypothetical protein
MGPELLFKNTITNVLGFFAAAILQNREKHGPILLLHAFFLLYATIAFVL